MFHAVRITNSVRTFTFLHLSWFCPQCLMHVINTRMKKKHTHKIVESKQCIFVVYTVFNYLFIWEWRASYYCAVIQHVMNLCNKDII